jgi:hypothetical protein
VSRQPLLVVLGLMGRIPFAGVGWQVLHYLEGFRRWGCDVYYVEDTGAWAYDPEQQRAGDDYTVSYIARLMAWCGLPDRWAYRSAAQSGRAFGLSESELSRLFDRADVLVSLSSPTALRDEHLRVPVRIYLETDPVLSQVNVANGDRFTIDLLGAHTHRFTFGENIGAPDCDVPLGPFDYLPTRQPVVLDWWAPSACQPAERRGCARAADRFTTITSWEQSGRDIEWNGQTYVWSKHLQFLKFIDLPRCTKQALELALASDDGETIRFLRSHGWRTVDAIPVSKDISPYREYILGSRGEFTVAKDQYVRPRSGWFSDRSACYLAAGRPVVTQDTGFGSVLPTGRGLFAFRTIEQVLDALEQIDADYDAHARAAREIAAEHFAAEKVVGSLLDRAGL